MNERSNIIIRRELRERVIRESESESSREPAGLTGAGYL